MAELPLRESPNADGTLKPMWKATVALLVTAIVSPLVTAGIVYAVALPFLSANDER